jgi:hypothetical protein
VTEARSLFASRALYDYLITRPLPERNRLPEAVESREEKTGGIFTRKRHTILRFSKPLPDKMMRMYKLVPLSPHDPVLARKAKHRFQREVSKGFAKGKGKYVHKLANSSNVLVWENNYNSTHPHALVEYNSAGKAVDVHELRTAEDVMEELWKLVPQSERDEYAKKSIPSLADVN